ncbi:MAG: hypothetical protein NT068_00350 [Candidatus Nomurabacteria bacterium]|nr:hypothetical protein [Candidatus Nomurabacteria bacterium]
MISIRQIYKQIIGSIIIGSIILMPFSGQLQKNYAEANSAGIAGYVKGLAPLIVSLPGCKEILKSGMQDMFSKIKGAFKKTKSSSGSGHDADPNGTGIDDTGTTTQAKAESVPVFDVTVYNNTKSTASSTSEIEASTGSMNKNQGCLNSIGKAVAKMLLTEMTKSMVEWINGGFDGTPKFVHDIPGFFQDVAKNEILQFGLEINNPLLFPFGKDFIKMQKRRFVKQFADNAKYSLNEVIANGNPGHTAADFKVSFADGGWGAWNAMTQLPQNNPIGFNVAASNEMQIRLDGTAKSTAQNIRDGIATANGYLNQERCASPSHDITRGEDAKALRGVDGARRCTVWETVTPGHLISESATKTLQFRSDSLLSVTDLNDAAAALIDASLSLLVTKVAGDDGYAGLSDDPNSDMAFNTDTSLTSNGNVEKDFPGDMGDSDWLNANQDFNIRTDLTQALIDEQRIFMQKLQDQNVELKSVKKIGNQKWNYGLLPIIYQLDYCIPGPHPGYEEEAQTNLDAAEAKIVDIGGMNFAQINKATGTGSSADWDTMFLAFNTFVVGTGGIANYETIDKTLHLTDKYAYQYLSDFPNKYLGIQFKKDGASESYSNTIEALDQAFSGYQAMINNVYNTLTLPGVADQAKREFNTASGYQSMFDKNVADIALKKADIKRLSDIKDKIDTLTIQKDNHTLPLTMIDPATNLITTDYNAQFEEDLKPYIGSFSRISLNMKTGDEIAKADSLLQQIKDKEKYIYNDLLKGATGCEKELSTPPAFKLWQLKRYNYPLPNIYNYDGVGSTIPDPFGNGIFHSGQIANTSVYQYESGQGAPGLWWVNFSSSVILPHFDGQEYSSSGSGNGNMYQDWHTIGSLCQSIAERMLLTTVGVPYGNCRVAASNFTNMYIQALNFESDDQGPYNITTFEKTLGIY